MLPSYNDSVYLHYSTTLRSKTSHLIVKPLSFHLMINITSIFHELINFNFEIYFMHNHTLYNSMFFIISKKNKTVYLIFSYPMILFLQNREGANTSLRWRPPSTYKGWEGSEYNSSVFFWYTDCILSSGNYGCRVVLDYTSSLLPFCSMSTLRLVW